MVQLIEPERGYTDVILRNEYEKKIEENPKQYLRFCPNATVNGVEVAFLICDHYKIFGSKEFILARYASFVGEKLAPVDGVSVFDENGEAPQFSISKLIDMIHVSDATWHSYKGKFKIVKPIAHW